MAVPKRRLSRSNTRHRRSSWKAPPIDLVPVQAVASDAGLESAAAEAALAAVVGAISSALVEGDKVASPGFGTFEVRDRAARTGRNPRTGEPLEIAASKAPAFKPATALKQAVVDDTTA